MSSYNIRRENFKPYLYIDIGKTGALFTLRETYLHEIYIPSEGDFGGSILNGVYQGTVETEVRSFHHKNLGQKPEDAFRKASEYAIQSGLHLNTKLDTLEDDLRKIKHRSAEDITNALKRQAIQATEFFERYRDRYILSPRKFHSGKYAGKTVWEVWEKDFQYVEWVAENTSYDSQKSFLQAFLDGRELPYVPESHYVGEIDSKVDSIYAEVVRFASYDSTDYYGNHCTKHIITFKVNEGDLLVWFTTSSKFDEDFKGNIKFTIKNHQKYEGIKQTIVNRVSVVKPKKVKKS